MLTLLYYLFYVGILIRICYKAFEYEKISPLERIVMPIYSLIMFLATYSATKTNIIALIVIIIVSFVIANYQISGVDVKEADYLDKRGRKVYLIKKNKQFLIGWFLIIALGIVFGIALGHSHLSSEHIIKEIIHEITKEVFAFYFFSSKDAWYIWALSGLSSYLFTKLLVKKYKKTNVK